MLASCWPPGVQAADTPATVTFDQALAADASDLARGYLVIGSQMQVAEVAGLGVPVHTTVDGRPQTITKSNYQAFESAYEAREHVYSQAMTQRGSSQIAGDYDMTASDGCKSLGLKDGPATITQSGFRFQWVTGPYQGKIALHGVVVESAVAAVSSIGADLDLRGKVADRVIELRSVPPSAVKVGTDLTPGGSQHASSCAVTLKLK